MSRKIIEYRPDLTEKARENRKNSTLSTRIIWINLRNLRASHYRFFRQKPIGNFIIDFYCKELKLAIEIDGISHVEKINYDKNRDSWLAGYGIKTIRFSDDLVVSNPDLVIQMIIEEMRIRELELGLGSYSEPGT